MLSVKGALALYGVCFAALLVVGSSLGAYGVGGVAAAEWVCVGLPVIAVHAVGPARTLEALRLRMPAAAVWGGAGLIGASAWIVIAFAVAPIQEAIVPTPPSLLEALQRTAAPGAPWWATLLAVALSPAICEELLCRGALVPALRERIGGRLAVVAAAALFALLHLSPYRFVATFLLGLSFGAIALASRSTLPAMLAHAINNSAVVLLSQPGAASLREGLERHRLVAVAIAVLALTIGHGIVHMCRRR